MSRLVIAEKPSVAQSLSAVLGAVNRKDGYLEGGGYLVSWCFGHLAKLSDASAYNPTWKMWHSNSLLFYIKLHIANAAQTAAIKNDTTILVTENLYNFSG